MVTFLMPGRRNSSGKTAWIIGTAATLVSQSKPESTKTVLMHMTSNQVAAHLTGGVNVNEADITS